MNDSLPSSNAHEEMPPDVSLPLGPNIILRLRDGTVHGWPQLTLSHWSCAPMPSGDRLTLLFAEHRVSMEGRGLGPVLNLLEVGSALELVEAGERHEAAFNSFGPLIRRATVETR